MLGSGSKTVAKRKNPFAAARSDTQDSKRQRTNEESLRSSKPLPLDGGDAGSAAEYAQNPLFQALTAQAQVKPNFRIIFLLSIY